MRLQTTFAPLVAAMILAPTLTSCEMSDRRDAIPSADHGGDGPAGTVATSVAGLPDGEVTACEWEWTVRTLHYAPSAVTPRRMYFSSCAADDDTPRMFTSLTLGANAPHPEEDPSSGAIMVADFDAATASLSPTLSARFPECISMHGIATSSDCSTIAALCRIPSGAQGADKDVLATHPAADWMTQPYVCGDRGVNDEMWLYEWTNGDITTEPKRYIVHKAIGSWEYGNNYLRYSEADNTYAIAVKATVGGEGGSGCHEADAFLVLDRSDYTMTTRGWSWACGTGHTLFNRPALDPSTNKYAMLCSTDFNEAGVGGLGGFYFRMENGRAQEFHHLNVDGIKNKGAASGLLAHADGGFLGVLVGVDGNIKPSGYPLEPPTSIGLGRWTAGGEMSGSISWLVNDIDAYVSYANLAPLGANRYLLGWGQMHRLGDTDEPREIAYRIPHDYYVMEIDGDGRPLTKALRLDGAGWGEVDEMVPLGDGRVGWTYIANPALSETYDHPSCNQPEVQMAVYQSAD